MADSGFFYGEGWLAPVFLPGWERLCHHVLAQFLSLPGPELPTCHSFLTHIWTKTSSLGGTQRHVESKETEQLAPQKFIDAPAPQQQQLREAAEARLRHARRVRDGHRGARAGRAKGEGALDRT